MFLSSIMDKCGCICDFFSFNSSSISPLNCFSVAMIFAAFCSLATLHPLMVIKQKKMDNRVKFYSWLISLLERRRLTFEEIANEWRDANANPEGEELHLRTVHRYRKALESQLGICVECSGKADDAFADEKKRVRYLPFDRISYMNVICEKHPLSAKMRRFLTPDRYYEDCFGIYKMDNIEPEKIRIRAFYPEYNYIEEVPLHESQERVRESPDGMYREYDLTVRPSYDFLQEMLWHGRNLIVLRPESLRQEMIAMLKDMTQSYETGECLNGEE